MHYTLRMYCTQGIHDRDKDFSRFFPVKLSAMLTDINIEAGTFDKIHYKICSTVFFKICMYADYIFISYELCKGLSLVKETILTIIKAGATLSGKRQNRGSLSGSHSIRKKFLNGHFIP